MTRGRFITLEGGEGVGKTTNLAAVVAFLEAQGLRVVATREPGGTPFGEKVRAIFLAEGDIAPQAELLLVFAARAQHLRDVIEPALASGAWVVCDRFTDASYAYQGGGRGIAFETIRQLEAQVQQGLTPDLTLLLDAPLSIGMSRAKRRGSLDRMEAETLAFFERVRVAYLRQATEHPERIKIVDAAQPLANVQADLVAHLQALLAVGTT
jgi:dTMP kinase